MELIVEHKADLNHIIVGAASILAKCAREEEIEILKKKYGYIGSLPYEEKIWVKNDNLISFENIGDIIENNQNNVKIFSLDNSKLNLINHNITHGFKHKKMEIFQAYFNNGMVIELSANHPVFTLSSKGFLKPKRLYELESGSRIAFTSLNVNKKPIRYLDTFALLKNYSTKKNSLYLKSEKIKSILKKMNLQKLKKILAKNTYNRTTLYQWIKTSKLPLHMIEGIYKFRLQGYIISRKAKECMIPTMLPIKKDFCWFLGIYLAEGCLIGEYKVDIANRDAFIIEKITKFLKKYKFGFVRTKNGVLIDSILLNKLIRSLHLGNNARTKSINPLFYNFSKENINLLLKGIYDGDGYKDGNSQEIEIYSKNLRDGIANLELLIGNLCSLRYRNKRNSFIARRLSKSTNSLSMDNIPSIIGVYLRNLRVKKNLSLREIERKHKINRITLGLIENQKVNLVSKKTLHKINKIYNDGILNNLINSNLFWLKLVKIISKGSKEMVYDLEIKPNNLQNFVGNGGIVLHNSGYQTDQITQKFVKENFDKYPEIFRKSWSTFKKHEIIKKQRKLNEF